MSPSEATTAPVTDDHIKATASRILPRLTEQLVELARIPSIATEGFPREPLVEAHDAVAAMLRERGVTDIGTLDVPGTYAPILTATVPGPPGAPTVLVYTHYDVVPEGDADLWEKPPFDPVLHDGAVYARGVADSKANIMALLGALEVYEGAPPVTVRIVIEGQEEFGSPFDFHPPHDPEAFRADAMVIADVGSVRPGSPTLTVALRGSASVTVTARTLASDKHSGQFGGAAPDARLALLRAVASLHDDHGDVAVEGLRREPWTGITYTDEEFRTLGGVLDDVPLQGTGTIGERIWSGPAISLIGFDAPASTAPLNAVASSATAVLNLRVHPEQDAREAQDALVRHLQAQRPFGITLEVVAGETGNGYSAATSGPAFDAASTALTTAWETPVGLMAGGGSIPLVMSLHEAVPEAEKLLFGATDGYANIHAPNERVLLDELERTVVAMAIFFRELGSSR